jgi:hypothetical protein
MNVPMQVKFRMLSSTFAIVRFAPDSAVPEWAMKGEFSSITRTRNELSVVCVAENVPPEIRSELRWICLKLQGPFPFSLTGVLLSFIEPLSSNDIPIFAISTYDTDYVLVPEDNSTKAVEMLVQAGYVMLSNL